MGRWLVLVLLVLRRISVLVHWVLGGYYIQVVLIFEWVNKGIDLQSRWLLWALWCISSVFQEVGDLHFLTLADHDFDDAVSEGMEVFDEEHLFNFVESWSKLSHLENFTVLSVFIKLFHHFYRLVRLKVSDKEIYKLLLVSRAVVA